MRARAPAFVVWIVVGALGLTAAVAQEPPADRPPTVEEPLPDRPEAAPDTVSAPAPEAAPASRVDDARPPVRPEESEAAPPPAAPETPETPEEPVADDDSPAVPPLPAQPSPLSLGSQLTLPTEAPLALAQGGSVPATPSIPATLRESDADYAACLRKIDRLGVGYTEIEPITDPEDRDCGIARPLQVETLRGGITLEGGAPMRCETALALAEWTRDFVLPAARRLPDSPRLTGLQLGSTYDCRGRVGTGAEAPKLSEHALGNAIDIMAFAFEQGEPLVVTPRAESGDMAEAFQRAVRGSACLFFTTVLGPGSNEAHDDHLHLDIAARNGGWRLCE
ncbi:extensin family protein (plasmid) [Paracoccus sp. TK19116]|uniref:Extensin family protein n=1 Tax=Paracoccus albicereus TaxID=2922394 RepID=A0ABT1MQ89_9RHOB|nr:extensin family protein [Paracoccus albicereus]MCQ0969106.1 extensin family protein [Paracoccus albicereus]